MGAAGARASFGAMKTRTETDTMGEIAVAADRYWGAQTQRSLENFKIGGEKMPLEVIRALAVVKQAAAQVNTDLKLLPPEKRDLIVKAAQEVIDGKLDDHFPLVDLADRERHPDEHERERGHLEPRDRDGGRHDRVQEADPPERRREPVAVVERRVPDRDERRRRDDRPELGAARGEGAARRPRREGAARSPTIVKIGRTHLQDATPLTLGQEFSGYVAQLDHAARVVEATLPHLHELALGGTAVGTGLNSHPEYAVRVAKKIAEITGLPFVTAPNKFESLAANDATRGRVGRARDARCRR